MTTATQRMKAFMVGEHHYELHANNIKGTLEDYGDIREYLGYGQTFSTYANLFDDIFVWAELQWQLNASTDTTSKWLFGDKALDHATWFEAICVTLHGKNNSAGVPLTNYSAWLIHAQHIFNLQEKELSFVGDQGLHQELTPTQLPQ